MKKIILPLAVVSLAATANAQFQVNPQLGINFQRITNPPVGSTYAARAGFLLGTDFRIGNRAYFQPGAFIGRNSTFVEYSDTVLQTGRLVRTNLKLKALVGYRIIDTYQFDLRFGVGPTYDVLLSRDMKDSDIAWNEGDFNTGSWNLDAALGLDMGHFTVEPGISFGLSRVFNDNQNVKDIDSRYLTYGLTIGLNFGDDDKNDEVRDR
ncbi:MAG: outer membrane beta-barrel protein [Flavobacteriales bacterium]